MDRQVSTYSFYLPGNDVSYDILSQNIKIGFPLDFWNGNANNEGISGFLRQNVRGVRFKASLNFAKSTQPDTFRSLFNDLIDEFTNQGSDSVKFYMLPYADITTEVGADVILGEGTSYDALYRNTIGIFSPTIELIGQMPLDEIPAEFELA